MSDKKIKFNLKTGYKLNHPKDGEYSYTEVEYFVITRKPSLFNLYKDQVIYYREKGKEHKEWELILATTIYPTKKKVLEQINHLVEQNKSENAIQIIDKIQSDLEDLKKNQ